MVIFLISGFVIKSFSLSILITMETIITKMISDEKANTDERLLQPFVQLQMSGLLLTSKKVRPSHLLGLPKETHQPPLQPKVKSNLEN